MLKFLRNSQVRRSPQYERSKACGLFDRVQWSCVVIMIEVNPQCRNPELPFRFALAQAEAWGKNDDRLTASSLSRRELGHHIIGDKGRLPMELPNPEMGTIGKRSLLSNI